MKDYLVWHYLTIRSDDIKVGDYYCFSKIGDTDRLNNRDFSYLIKLSLIEVTLMRLKGRKEQYVWQAVKKSKYKRYSHHRVQGKLIHSLSQVDL